MTMRRSIAMSERTDCTLRQHLLRPDGQEDACLVTYRPSHGATRWSALVRDVVMPLDGERAVHGNASFTGEYILRAVELAAASACGIGIVHSHPGGSRWQGMSGFDADAERSYAYLAHELTGLPLVGMTLAGRDGAWSARTWDPSGEPQHAENVRVVGSRLRVSWNDAVRPAYEVQATQTRTVSGWGADVQRDLARLRVLVVGLGSVGLDVAIRLAATGIESIGLMDFDIVEAKNLDRLVGATPTDAWLARRKIDVARRLVLRAATAPDPAVEALDLSVCEDAGLENALDYDVVFSCVDRPWPRAVLNTIAYSDLIPVVDGGIHIDAFEDGGMRNATWRTHVIRPGRPCLVCNGQLDPSTVAIDREGLLDDPAYIAGSDVDVPARQNVAALSVNVVAGLLSQFVSLVVAPGGIGEPGPLQYVLSTHTQDSLDVLSRPNCAFEDGEATGSARLAITGPDAAAHATRSDQRQPRQWLVRVARFADAQVEQARAALDRAARRRIGAPATRH
jgi:hypothetical protein